MTRISFGGRTIRGSGVDYQRRRLIGTASVVAIFWVSIGVILTFAFGIYPLHGGGFPVIPRPPYTRSYDPITVVEQGLPANVPVDTARLRDAPKDVSIQLLALRPGGVTLVAGGRPVRYIATPAPVTEIGELCDLVADRNWIERSGPRQVALKSALVVYPGVELAIGGASVDDLVLLNRIGTFIGANGGGLNFERIRVHVASAVPQSMDRYRPFILAIGQGVMRFHNTVVDGLGWDWNGSYGVSWQDGSTGEAVDTTFENSFIGVYTARSSGLLFRRCVFRKNYLYGFDPHTYSRKIVVDESLAEGNGAHGFIFSEYVRESVIMNSTSRGNGENGIMMDRYSTGNLIHNNTVTGNRGDGIVTADSPRNSFHSNVIRENRVGVKTSPRDARSTIFEANKVVFNNIASEDLKVANGQGGNTVMGNGGQWNTHALRMVWSGIAAALLISVVLLSVHARKWRSKALRHAVS